MEIKGKVVGLLEEKTFVSSRSGKEYVWNTFILETEGEYPKKLAMQVEGRERFAKMNIQMGGEYTVSFDVESTEWNGKWFTRLTAWKAICANGYIPVPKTAATQAPTSRPQAVQAPTYTPTQESANNNNNDDDLPF